jgi:hypothetical protein
MLLFQLSLSFSSFAASLPFPLSLSPSLPLSLSLPLLSLSLSRQGLAAEHAVYRAEQAALRSELGIRAAAEEADSIQAELKELANSVDEGEVIVEGAAGAGAAATDAADAPKDEAAAAAAGGKPKKGKKDAKDAKEAKDAASAAADSSADGSTGATKAVDETALLAAEQAAELEAAGMYTVVSHSSHQLMVNQCNLSPYKHFSGRKFQ